MVQSFITGIQQHPVPTTVHTTNDSRIATTTITGSELEKEEMKFAINKKSVKLELRRQLHKYIKERTFRRAKFPLAGNGEFKACVQSVEDGAVQLPHGVDARVFAEEYSGMVKPRLRELRNYCQDVAKKRFISKCLFQKSTK